MKRIMIGTLLFIGLAGVGFGMQVSAGPNRGISVAGGTTLATFKSGGFLEVGFPLFEGARAVVRDYLSLNGYGTSPTSGGTISLSDKLTVGGVWPRAYETYGFLAAGLGAFGTSTLSFAPPFLVDVEIGGGMQIDLSSHFSYFMEAGGGWNFPTSSVSSVAGPPFRAGFALFRSGFEFFL